MFYFYSTCILSRLQLHRNLYLFILESVATTFSKKNLHLARKMSKFASLFFRH
ncbi:MAG: hypothetical protein H6Q17_2023 [Bacteroidetes bacterium]|jgi:hypothetical protein|nr:hypothetical protein [Bacteroidota bacterium]